MIFLGQLQTITSTKSEVFQVHNMPFDPVEGMGKTQAELETIGILVDSLPNPDYAGNPGKSAKLYVDLTTKTTWYEYVDRPLNDQERIQQVESQNAQMLLALVNGGLM